MSLKEQDPIATADAEFDKSIISDWIRSLRMPSGQIKIDEIKSFARTHYYLPAYELGRRGEREKQKEFIVELLSAVEKGEENNDFESAGTMYRALKDRLALLSHPNQDK